MIIITIRYNDIALHNNFQVFLILCNFHDISFQGAQGEAGDSGPPGPPGPAVSIQPTLAIFNNALELVRLTLRASLERLSEIHKEWLFSLSITTHVAVLLTIVNENNTRLQLECLSQCMPEQANDAQIPWPKCKIELFRKNNALKTSLSHKLLFLQSFGEQQCICLSYHSYQSLISFFQLGIERSCWTTRKRRRTWKRRRSRTCGPNWTTGKSSAYSLPSQTVLGATECH